MDSDGGDASNHELRSTSDATIPNQKKCRPIVWEQWADTNYSQQFCYKQFLQYKSLCHVHNIWDQLVGLCKCIEVVVQSNPSLNNIMLIQNVMVQDRNFSFYLPCVTDIGVTYSTPTLHVSLLHMTPSELS
jgi:hypothetical protein